MNAKNNDDTEQTIIRFTYYDNVLVKAPELRKWKWKKLKSICRNAKTYHFIDHEQNKTEKIKGACISFAILYTSQWQRANKNVKHMVGIILDLERKTGDHPSRKKIEKALQGVEYVGYTTNQHTPDTPRYRILIPFKSPIDPDDFNVVFRYFEQKFHGHLDPQVKSLVQLALLPRVPDIRIKYFEYFEGKGSFFDPTPILAQRDKYTLEEKSEKAGPKKRHEDKAAPIDLPKIDLDDLDISDECKSLIISGDTRKFGGDRSRLVFHAVTELYQAQVSREQIAAILLKPEYGISQRHFEGSRGQEWVLKDVERILGKQSTPRLIPGVKPHYPKTHPLTVKKASRLLHESIGAFFHGVYGNLGINGSAGLGKTRACFEFLKTRKPGQGVVEFYVPTHELAEELSKALRQEASHLKIQVIAGRAHEKIKGNPLCKRADLAQALSRKGLPIYKSLCRQDETTLCPHINDCGYLKQFRSNVDVRILTHAHLSLPRTSLDAGLPDFAIIDESFFQSLLDIQTYKLNKLTSAKLPSDLKTTIYSALDQRLPLFKALEDQFGGNVEEVLSEALKALKGPRMATLSPSMDHKRLQKSIKRHKAFIFEQRLLNSLLQEYQSINVIYLNTIHHKPRSESLTVRPYPRNRLAICQRKKIIRFKEIIDDQERQCPILYLDANLDPEIAEIFLGKLHCVNIEAERNSHIIQCYSTRNAKWRFKYSEDDPDHKKNLFQRHCENTRKLILKYWKNDSSERLLVIGYKNLIDGILKVKTRKTICTAGGPGYLEYQHYGNLRGKDIYKRFDVCALVGRLQPATHDLENIAAALWWDSSHILNLLGEQVEQVRGYRLRNGAKYGVSTMVHPDRRVQLVQEQIREGEMLQGMDRLRLIHASEKKTILILCNIPLPIEVDELISYRDLTKGSKINRLIEHYHYGVTPLSPRFLFKHHPELFNTENDAKQTVKRFKDEHASGKYEYGNHRYSVRSYRVKGEAGGAKTVLVNCKTSRKKLMKILRRLHEKDIALA